MLCDKCKRHICDICKKTIPQHNRFWRLIEDSKSMGGLEDKDKILCTNCKNKLNK